MRPDRSSSDPQTEVCERRKAGPGDHIAGFEQLDRMVMSARTSFLVSRSRSDRSTPQKLFCSSKDSTPACSSFRATCRVHAIRNFVFCDPRCKLMIIPGCNSARRPPIRAPVCVMSIVCARWVTLSSETLTDNTIFLRDDLRFSSINNHYHSYTNRGKSYRSHYLNRYRCCQSRLDGPLLYQVWVLNRRGNCSASAGSLSPVLTDPEGSVRYRTYARKLESAIVHFVLRVRLIWPDSVLYSRSPPPASEDYHPCRCSAQTVVAPLRLCQRAWCPRRVGSQFECQVPSLENPSAPGTETIPLIRKPFNMTLRTKQSGCRFVIAKTKASPWSTWSCFTTPCRTWDHWQ